MESDPYKVVAIIRSGFLELGACCRMQKDMRQMEAEGAALFHVARVLTHPDTALGVRWRSTGGHCLPCPDLFFSSPQSSRAQETPAGAVAAG